MRQLKISKLLFIVFVFLVSSQVSYGQKTEINLNAYGGLFSFRGEGSTATTWINDNPYITPQKFTSNPYGQKSEFSYSFELQGQRITKNKNIYGVGIGFETLTSRVSIDTALQEGFMNWKYSADGKATLKNTFLTLNPFVGHRFSYHKVSFDILTGFDLAFCVKSKEDGNATASNKEVFTSENDKSKPLIDFRPRVQIKTQLKQFGVIVGYSLGLTNFQTQYNPKAYSSYLRLGLSYQLK